MRADAVKRYLQAGAAMLLGAGSVLAISTGVGSRDEARSEPARGGDQTIDWTAPLAGAGVQVPSGPAPTLLTFVPVDVSALGTPNGTFVTNPSLSTPPGRVIAWSFDHPKYGTFVVVEEISQTTQAELESLAGCDPGTGCQGSWSIVQLETGPKGLLVEGPASTAFIWLDRGMRLTVMGPPGVFSPASAEEIADTLQRAGV